MDPQEVAVLISVVILLVLAGTIITLLVVFVRRKNQLIDENENLTKTFKLELAKSQIEIREETLRNISWELHDNIGQLLSLAKIHAQLAKDNPSKIPEVISILGKGLDELRALSKLINPDAIKELTLKEAISLEIERYNRLEYIQSTLTIQGEIVSIDPNKGIILFRILQEFFSNTVKHSKATKLDVVLKYDKKGLEITAKDNGIGFEKGGRSKGIGLQNMKNRAALIHADFSIMSKVNEGTSISLKLLI